LEQVLLQEIMQLVRSIKVNGLFNPNEKDSQPVRDRIGCGEALTISKG